MSEGSRQITGPVGGTKREGARSFRVPEKAFFRRLLAAVAVVALCLGPAVSLAAGAPVSPEVSPAPGEKPVTAKIPVIPTTSPKPEETSVTARSADPVAAPNATASPEITPTLSPVATVLATTDDGDEDDEEGEPIPIPTLERDAPPRPNATVLATTDDGDEPVPTLEAPTVTDAQEPTAPAIEATDDGDEDEEEGEPIPIPTLERDVPPRPNATMARSHQFIDRPLPQGDHPLVRPTPPLSFEKNETEVPQLEVIAPQDGLFVRGVGVLLARTPEGVALTRNGVEIATLDWLLDVAMRLAGRHPRVAMEGERFTVTVTVEARNMTFPASEPAYVVLVPPPGEIAVYDITRTKEPESLRAGERGVWEFSVVTRTGRLTLENLTLSEERFITNMTSYPDVFAFRAYAIADGQDAPSMGFSDPVIAIRPGGSVKTESTLPALYALLLVDDSILQPSETAIDAWRRGVDYGEFTAVAGEHLDTLGSLGKEEVAAVHAGQGRAGAAAGPSLSPLDLIAEFFSNIFRWFSGVAG